MAAYYHGDGNASSTVCNDRRLTVASDAWRLEAANYLEFSVVNYDLSNPKMKAELEWIASFPASEDAERLLAIAEVSRPFTHQPAILALFEWAVFEASETFGIDPTKAEGAMTTVQLIEMDKGPAAAVTYLLNLDNPEEETLHGLATAETPEEAAWAAIGMAD